MGVAAPAGPALRLRGARVGGSGIDEEARQLAARLGPAQRGRHEGATGLDRLAQRRPPREQRGEGVRVAGTISGTGSFVVCGEVESDCDLNGPVTLAKDGRWKGTIRASNVIIAGEVEGDVRTEGKIEVASTAYVRGSLVGRRIAVDEGAVIEGEMQMLSGSDVVNFNEKRDD